MMKHSIDSPEVQEAIADGRVSYIGRRRGKVGYKGEVSRVYTKRVDGEKVTYYEIDVNCIGGVRAPMAKRNPLAGFINMLRPGG